MLGSLEPSVQESWKVNRLCPNYRNEKILPDTLVCDMTLTQGHLPSLRFLTEKYLYFSYRYPYDFFLTPEQLTVLLGLHLTLN